MNRAFGLVVAVGLLMGCNATTTGTTSIQVKSKDATTLKARSLDFGVFAPKSLADAAGKIVNADPSGIVAQGAGNIVAQGAGNIVAQGAGNLAAPTFRLQATESSYIPVESAVVQLFDINDKPISKSAVTSRADGTVTLKGVPDGKPLVAVARWKAGDKLWRTSAVIAAGTPDGPTMLDPINHFVHARVKDILAKSGKLSKVDPDDLKKVWEAFNRADIAFDGQLLAEDATADDLIAFYKEQVAKLPCADQKLVKDYMVQLGADPVPVDCN